MPKSRRRSRITSHRRVWLISEPNPDLTPQAMATLLAAAALEQQAHAQEAGKRDA